MPPNRSVPASICLPHICYRSLPDAIAWLSRAFGFVETFRYGDPSNPDGAQMTLGPVCIMLLRARPGFNTPSALGAATQSLTVFIENVEAHCARAAAAGASIQETPHETEYGEFQYAALDLDGHHWLFSRHVRDVHPSSWGALTAS